MLLPLLTRLRPLVTPVTHGYGHTSATSQAPGHTCYPSHICHVVGPWSHLSHMAMVTFIRPLVPGHSCDLPHMAVVTPVTHVYGHIY